MLIIPNILRTIVIGLFLDTYLKIKYPIEYENLKIDLLYKSIYFYSRGQLFLNKMIADSCSISVLIKVPSKSTTRGILGSIFI